MPAPLFISEAEPSRYVVHHDRVSLVTRSRVEFLDITELVVAHVRSAGINHGTVNIQTLHTTTAIRVNENEPLLIEDLKLLFERLVPRSRRWLHDDLDARQGPLAPDESKNGDAHARAILLGSSETLNVIDGEVQLGAWQRVFLIELDGGRRRTLSLTATGLAATPDHDRERLDLRSVS